MIILKKPFPILLTRLILVSFIVTALFSCNQTNVKKVFVYDISVGPVEILNGNVKCLTIGDSLILNGSFYKIYFDKKGDQVRSEFRSLNTTETEGSIDTNITDIKVRYTPIYDNDDVKTGMVGNASAANNKWAMKWTFDTKGIITKYEPYPSDSKTESNKLKYDSIGNLIEYKHIYQGVHLVPDIFKYKYDDHNRLTELALYNEETLVSKTSFEYLSFDAHNNCTKLKVRREFPLFSKASRNDIITRKIAYY